MGSRESRAHTSRYSARRHQSLSFAALTTSDFLSLLLLLFLLACTLVVLCFSLILWLGLWLWLVLRWSGRVRWSGDRGARAHDDLVLALSVGDDCAQQQGYDSHEVEVPLWPQQLVQIHLRNGLLHLAAHKN